MKEESDPITTVLRPVLDTYMDAAVTVVGCYATGIYRESCELDVIVVTNETRPYAAVKFGDAFFDLYFISENEALNPADHELAVSLAQSRPVRDSSLVISTSLASNQAVMGENARRCSRLRLTSCLKALARTDESLSQNWVRAANFWLLNASYDFAYSWLYGQETVPSPSHILKQLKEHSKGSSLNLEAFSKGAGLGRSSRRECAMRLDALSVLYDLMGTQQGSDSDPRPSTTEVGYQIVKRKAEYLAQLMEHVESYSYLGDEAVKLLLAVSKTRHREVSQAEHGARVTELFSDSGQGLLSGKLIRDLGLERPKTEVEEALAAVKVRAAKLARRI